MFITLWEINCQRFTAHRNQFHSKEVYTNVTVPTTQQSIATHILLVAIAMLFLSLLSSSPYVSLLSSLLLTLLINIVVIVISVVAVTVAIVIVNATATVVVTIML